MNRKGKVFYKDYLAGVIEETETGYRFSYDEEYLSNEKKWQPLNLCMASSVEWIYFFSNHI